VLRMRGKGNGDTTADTDGESNAGADAEVLRISYHAHFFALGAHYNSVVKISE
jgi:hypothetical protein